MAAIQGFTEVLVYETFIPLAWWETGKWNLARPMFNGITIFRKRPTRFHPPVNLLSWQYGRAGPETQAHVWERRQEFNLKEHFSISQPTCSSVCPLWLLVKIRFYSPKLQGCGKRSENHNMAVQHVRLLIPVRATRTRYNPIIIQTSNKKLLRSFLT